MMKGCTEVIQTNFKSTSPTMEVKELHASTKLGTDNSMLEQYRNVECNI